MNTMATVTLAATIVDIRSTLAANLAGEIPYSTVADLEEKVYGITARLGFQIMSVYC